jgi:peptidoglycan hydrolase-like protein with peptidoglycan-binding domain
MIIPIILGAGALLLVLAKTAMKDKLPIPGIDGPLQLPEAKLPGVTPPPAVPEAFTDLASTALATGDTQGAEKLAQDAQKRGLDDTATNIRQEIAASTGAPVKPTPITNTPKAIPVSGRPLLKIGSRGADVIEWQHVIGVKPDGIFGLATASTTIAWQKSHGLAADGIVGPASWAIAYQAIPALGKTPPAPAIAPITSSVIYKAPVAGHPTIRRGSTGQAVRDWQTMLVAAGNTVAIDGQFGAGTDSATRQFQKAHGLVVDGVVGPATWGAGAARATSAAAVINTMSIDAPRRAPIAGVAPPLAVSTSYPTIRRGSTGDAVKTWQGRLGLKPDGIFGPITETQTKAFQAAKGLKADGIVGPMTWAASSRR